MSDELDVEMLDRLNPQQLAKVVRLINKLANKNEGADSEEVVVAKPKPEVEIIHRNKAPNRVEQKKKAQKSGSHKSRAAAPEPLYTGKRENEFKKMEEFEAHQEDKLVDAKLNKYKPIPRGNRESTIVDVVCRKCHEEFQVSKMLVTYDHGKPKFTCNVCLLQRG